MSMMQRLKSCKIMKKLRNGLRKRNRFHYLLGLRNESHRETNAKDLREGDEKLPENAKKNERGCENICNATEKFCKEVKKMVIGMPFRVVRRKKDAF